MQMQCALYRNSRGGVLSLAPQQQHSPHRVSVFIWVIDIIVRFLLCARSVQHWCEMGMSHNDNRLTQIKTDSEILSHYKNTLQPYPTLSPIFLSVTSVVVCFCWPTYSFRCPHIDSPLEGQLKVRVCNADFCNEVCSRCLYLDLGISFLVRSSFFWIQAERMQDRYSVVRTRTVLTYTHNHNHNHTHTWHTFFPPHTHTYSHAICIYSKWHRFIGYCLCCRKEFGVEEEASAMMGKKKYTVEEMRKIMADTKSKVPKKTNWLDVEY